MSEVLEVLKSFSIKEIISYFVDFVTLFVLYMRTRKEKALDPATVVDNELKTMIDYHQKSVTNLQKLRSSPALEVGKEYILLLDEGEFKSKFVGFYGKHKTLAEFSSVREDGSSFSILLSKDEVKRCVYGS